MRGIRPLAATLLCALAVTACAAPAPDPTPYPTPAPTPRPDEVEATVRTFLSAWRGHRWERAHEMIAGADQERYPFEAFASLLARFHELAAVRGMNWEVGEAVQITLPPQARPPDQPAPPPTPLPTASAGEPTPTPASPSPEPSPVPPDTPLDGPVPALMVPVELQFSSDLFGEVALERELVLVGGTDGWQVRWEPEILFPELGQAATLELTRQAPPRGRILAQDGTVLAQTRADGIRVYPQEWLAGQTVGYATPATADDLAARGRQGWVEGDLVGRSGLEHGADELLRGSPGFTLLAVPETGDPVPVLERPMVPGADVLTTLRPAIQATAQAAIAGYAEAGTAVIDPLSGDVWALASAPLFNPNAMTIGTTLAGQPLNAPGVSARANHATVGAYPAGSSFKVFTLAAALKTGVAGPGTRMTCNGTWTFSGFTFRNYLEHRLPGTVDLLQAMAFSCNTTYMPLSILVYDHDQRALTDVVREFGFGEFTGIKYVVEESGILPDHDYFEAAKRWHGGYSPYGAFDQIQLSIGQGDYLGTPLQLANAYAAIGNGGTLWVPRIVTEARLPDGEVVERVEPTARREISIPDEQLAYVVDSMQAVVNYSYGTAYGPFLGFGIPVAGKSGTAETGGPNPNAWFPAIAPADAPEISVATVLVRVPLATGGSDAAPLVRRVMATYFAGQ
ncbi:MAG: penicillin-binding transpeptidase domain-containing protein [Candidatus Limnocylindria bacterium]